MTCLLYTGRAGCTSAWFPPLSPFSRVRLPRVFPEKDFAGWSAGSFSRTAIIEHNVRPECARSWSRLQIIRLVEWTLSETSITRTSETQSDQPASCACLEEVSVFTVVSALRESTVLHHFVQCFEFIVIKSSQVFCFTHWRSISVLYGVCVSEEIDSFPVETGSALQSGMWRFVKEAQSLSPGDYSSVIRSLKRSNHT